MLCKLYNLLIVTLFLFASATVFASGVMSEEDVDAVSRVRITDEDKISKVAGLLAQYEIEANKLIASLSSPELTAEQLDQQAQQLLSLSESVFKSARFRLPQCAVYLDETLKLKAHLATISNEKLESDYHHDGALPKAPVECYHTKDLFVHPATVIVLTRDDPSLMQKTKIAIEAEITEVLGHTDIVREVVIY